MSGRIRSLVLTAAICGLLVGGASAQNASAQQKAAAANAKAAQKLQKKAARAQLNQAEITLMRQAWILMDMANANYDGHRGRALDHLNGAIEHLELRIARDGFPAQQITDLRQEAVRQYYKSLRKAVPAVIEPQMQSNAQMYQAGQLLVQLRGALVANNQKNLLGRINHTIDEITLALRTSAARSLIP